MKSLKENDNNNKNIKQSSKNNIDNQEDKNQDKNKDKNIETKDNLNDYNDQKMDQSLHKNIDPNDKNHDKNENIIIETKDNENDNNDQNKHNDHVQLMEQYNLQLKSVSFPKINRGKTTLFKLQKFSYKNEECYNYSKKCILTMKNNHLLFKKLLWKCLMILQIIQKQIPISICIWVAMLH